MLVINFIGQQRKRKEGSDRNVVTLAALALRPKGHEDAQCVLSFTKHLLNEQTFPQCEVRFPGWVRQGKEYRILFSPVS